MCVIAYKAKEVRFPSNENMKKMWEANPDGAGVMWRDDDGLIHWKKGFMSFKKLKRWVKKNRDWLEKVECALHFRITTHGGTCKGNCHPFPIDASANPHVLSGESDYVLMHNGILPIDPRSKDISDSAELALRLGEHEKPCESLQEINDRLNGNRIVIFAPNETRFYGDKFKKSENKDNEGILYSNLNWEWEPLWNKIGYSSYGYSGTNYTSSSLTSSSVGGKISSDCVDHFGKYWTCEDEWEYLMEYEHETISYICKEYGLTYDQAKDIMYEAESYGEDVFDYIETYYNGFMDPEEREYAIA